MNKNILLLYFLILIIFIHKDLVGKDFTINSEKEIKNKKVLTIGVPDLLSPKNNEVLTISSCLLNWSGVPDANNYDVQVSIDSTFKNIYFGVTRTTYNSVYAYGLLPSSYYYWRVRAQSLTDKGDWSTPFRFKTYHNLKFPVLTYPADKSTRILMNSFVSWGSVEFAERYLLEVCTSNDFNNIVFRSETQTTNFNLDSMGLEYEKTYYWRTRALAKNDSGPWSSVWNFTTTGAFPKSTILLSPDYNGKLETDKKYPNCVFKWHKDIYSDSYTIQFSEDSSFSSPLFQKVNIVDTSFFMYDMNNKYRYWRIRGSNIWGIGPWSEARLLNFVLDVNKLKSQPDNFILFQNYPNPFNPNTTISFSIPQKSFVKITVYDINGMEIETLINGVKDSGIHYAIWTPKNISSGIYYCRFFANNKTIYRKLVYLR